MNEITTVSDNFQISEEQIKNYFCSNATKDELAFACLLCKQQSLNPIKGDVFFVKYKDKMQIIVSKYAFLKKAERNSNYDGFKAWTEIINNELVGKCEVYRKDRRYPFTGEVWFSEYNQKNTMWNTKPKTMIRKVAIVHTLREAFPDELGGLYCEDELSDYTQQKNALPLPSITPEEVIETSDEDFRDLFKKKCLSAGLEPEALKFFCKRNKINTQDVNSMLKFLENNDINKVVAEFKGE